MKDHVERPQHLIDLDGLPLDEFSIGDGDARIGALVKMSDLADNADLRRHYPVIAEALLASASPQVRNMANTRRLSSNRMLKELIENGIEAEKRKQQEFFELAERFRNATDPQEAKRLGDELGRMVFGS